MARVLIVDDSEHIRQLLSITLRHRGHEVTEAKNGREGLDALKNGVFDLVITDLDMPVMNGFDFLRTMRDELGEKAPTCLVLTAEPRETRERVLGLGAAGLLVKPFSPIALYDEIEKHLSA
jgi:two-component system chemotaxis response regulator CheY